VKRPALIRAALSLAAGALLVGTRAWAEPADYVHQPAVEPGEREIDFKFGTDGNGATSRESAASLGVGYGATDWWFTELYVNYRRLPGEGTTFDALEWENKFQLTETGRYPVDVGMLLEIEHPQDRAEGWEVAWGPLFQTEFGKLQLNFNPLLRRNYRAEGFAETVFQYEWQAKYRWRRHLEFGLQGFGETGKWNAWAPRNEQNHRMGPAIFGKLPAGSGSAIEYNLAWLFGASQAAPDHTLRLQVEFEY
jgi:hypothetical protein